MTKTPTDVTDERDDTVAAFQVEGRAVRGRAIRLGQTMDQILSVHDYPPALARLLGEAVMIAALVGDALKFDGRLIVQANGDGPVRFIVAEYVSGEGVRGFAKMDRDAAIAALEAAPDAPVVETLLGKGAFAMTIDYGTEKDQYQGVVALDGHSLAGCAEGYFEQSEQTPTRLRLAVGEHWDAEGTRTWRAGGMLLQAIAGDAARGDVAADWDHGRALFGTLQDAELLDPDLATASLLYRLFNEDGVRLQAAMPIVRRCSCERERLRELVANFSPEDQAHMVVDGDIVLTCEYCNRDWMFKPEEVAKQG
jgi:molecular chaperone Hsp33